MTEHAMPARMLPGHGRCCGRKPIIYSKDRYLFCPRCNRAYAFETGAQQDNWAWKTGPDGFEPTYPKPPEYRLDGSDEAYRAAYVLARANGKIFP